jgi:hypothetical protein
MSDNAQNSFRMVFAVEIKAGGVDPKGRPTTPTWMLASASFFCKKIYEASGWAPVFESKRDAQAAADLIAEQVPAVVQTRILQKRHPAKRTLWPRLNRLLDALEEIGNGALDGWPATVRRDFATHAVPMLETALLRMRQRLGEATVAP